MLVALMPVPQVWPARPVPQLLLLQLTCPLAPHASHIPLALRVAEAVHVICEKPPPGNPVPPPAPPAPVPPPAPVAPQQIWPTAPQVVPVPSWHEPLLQVPVTPLPAPVQVEPLAWHMFPTQQPPSLQLFEAQQRCPSPPQVAPEAPPALAPPVPAVVAPPEPVVVWPPVPDTVVPPLPEGGAVPPEPDVFLLLLEQAASAATAATRYPAARGEFEASSCRVRVKRRLIGDLHC